MRTSSGGAVGATPPTPSWAGSLPGGAHVPGGAQARMEAQRRLAALAGRLLLVVFFALYMVGDHPFAVVAVDKAAAAESGSLLNRFLIFGIMGLAAPLMLVRCGGLARLLLANLLGGLIVAWSLGSFAWATHPDLTVRRGIAFGIVYLNLATIVAATRSAQDVFRALVLALAALTLLNVAVMVAMPAVSTTPIGQKGVFDSKNTAGTLGMLTVVFLGVALFQVRSLWARAALAPVYLLAWAFLVATKSKTSLGVAGLITLAAPAIHQLLLRGSGLRFVALLALIAGGFGAVVAASSAGFGSDDLLMLLFGDLTFTQRTPIWGDVVRSIGDRPWLGFGFGSFWDVGEKMNPLRYAPWDAFYVEAQVINTAHSGYLDQLLQTGIVGFSLGVAAILRCIRTLWACAVRTGDEGERLALLALLCVAVCLMLNNFLESYLFRSGDGMGYLFFVLMLQAEQTRLDLADRPDPPPAEDDAGDGMAEEEASLTRA